MYPNPLNNRVPQAFDVVNIMYPNPLMSSIIVYLKPLMWLNSYVTTPPHTESDLGFKFDWSTVRSVTDVAAVGPATQILEPGDRIIKVSSPFQVLFFALKILFACDV